MKSAWDEMEYVPTHPVRILKCKFESASENKYGVFLVAASPSSGELIKMFGAVAYSSKTFRSLSVKAPFEKFESEVLHIVFSSPQVDPELSQLLHQNIEHLFSSGSVVQKIFLSEDLGKIASSLSVVMEDILHSSSLFEVSSEDVDDLEAPSTVKEEPGIVLPAQQELEEEVFPEKLVASVLLCDDPVCGTPLVDLKIGDAVYVKIDEPRLFELVSLFEGIGSDGTILPIQCRLMSVKMADKGEAIATVKLGENIFGEAKTYYTARIQTRENDRRNRNSFLARLESQVAILRASWPILIILSSFFFLILGMTLVFRYGIIE